MTTQNNDFHSRISPSSFGRLWHCQWWVKAADKWGRDQTTAAATEGTLAHDLGATCLTSSPNANYYTRHKLPESKQTVSQEMADLIQLYADYVTDIRNDLIATAGNKALMEYHIEKRVGSLTKHKEAHGTADVIMGQHFGALHVIDLKYGKAPVSPINNKQLMGYAAFSLDTFGCFDPIYLHIYQPRVERKSPFKVWKTSTRELREFEKELYEKMRIAEKPNAPCAEGEGCWFCPVKHVCPVKEEKNLSAADEVFGDFDDFDEDEILFTN